jgi:hypothetical protein
MLKKSRNFSHTFLGKKENRAHNINVYDIIIEMKERQEWLSEYLRRMDFGQIDFVVIFSIFSII